MREDAAGALGAQVVAQDSVRAQAIVLAHLGAQIRGRVAVIFSADSSIARLSTGTNAR